jgi:hypothetical protein
VGYFGDASSDQLRNWGWFYRTERQIVDGQRPSRNIRRRRRDDGCIPDDADANEHGDGHAGPDFDATGGVAAGAVFDAGAGETLPGAGQSATDADAVPIVLRDA